MRLEEKTAVVTDAARGIGRAIAVRFAAEGARLVVVDLREAEGRDRVAAIEAAGGSAAFFRTGCQRRGAGNVHRGGNRGPLGTPRHPRQRRQHLSLRGLPKHARVGLAERTGHEPQGVLPRRASGCAHDGRTRRSRQVEELSLGEIARERWRLVEAALSGTLGPDDSARGTFTLSNLGAYRVDQFQPVLNPPESAILASGHIAPRPFVANGQLLMVRTIVLTIACDHRVLVGAVAEAFFDRLIRLIEAPYGLLV